MLFRILLRWKDKRYITGNKHRISECGSKDVLWNKPNQFWLPKLRVMNTLELVSLSINIYNATKMIFNTNMYYFFKGGFLEEPEKEGTAGNRNLKYHVSNGQFTLFTMSYAKLECRMYFGYYPFDSQKCDFIIGSFRNLSYQEMQILELFYRV